jgi:hypothetical protein
MMGIFLVAAADNSLCYSIDDDDDGDKKSTIEQIEEIKQKATYIFANRRNMEEHNREQLKRQHSAINLIANSSYNFIKR